MGYNRRERDGVLIGAGAALILAALIVLQPLVGSGLFSTQTVTETVTTSDAYEQISDAYTYHLMQLDDRNIPGIVYGYESNATVEWTGVIAGMAGNYSGSKNIDILMGSFIGKINNFSLANESQVVGVEDDGLVVINSTFNFRGYNTVVGNMKGTIIAQDVYERVGDSSSSWLIARETWNFTQFQEQFPVGI